MRHEVQALDTFENKSENSGGLGFLKAIKDLEYNFKSQKYLYYLTPYTNLRAALIYAHKASTQRHWHTWNRSRTPSNIIKHSVEGISEVTQE